MWWSGRGSCRNWYLPSFRVRILPHDKGSCEYRRADVKIVLQVILIPETSFRPFIHESISSSISLLCCSLTHSSCWNFKGMNGFSIHLSCWCILELISAWINIVWKPCCFLFCLKSCGWAMLLWIDLFYCWEVVWVVHCFSGSPHKFWKGKWSDVEYLYIQVFGLIFNLSLF